MKPLIPVAVLLMCLTTGVPREAESASGHVRVALATDQTEVAVRSEGGVVVSTAHGRRARANWVKVRWSGKPHSSSTEDLLVNGVRFESPVWISGRSGPVEFNGVRYRGTVVVAAREHGLLVTNQVDLEDYVKSVVPSEVPATWPFEALKAQAIVSRTYALYQQNERGQEDFDVDATTRSQVYGGLQREDVRATEAVEASRGVVVTYGGRLALTPYHSTSAGPTEDAAEVWGIDLPYLKGVADAYDGQSAVSRWDRRFSYSAIESSLRRAGYAVGPIATVTPLGRTRSGRVAAVRILHADGELILKGEAFRRVLGYQDLPSTRFDVVSISFSDSARDAEVHLRGGGWGHGVGLCQWGMKALAERGWSADHIIRYYYPGTSLDGLSTVAARGR